MEWSGQQMFGLAPMKPFSVDGEEAGQLKTYGPLSFLKVSFFFFLTLRKAEFHCDQVPILKSSIMFLKCSPFKLLLI